MDIKNELEFVEVSHGKRSRWYCNRSQKTMVVEN